LSHHHHTLAPSGQGTVMLDIGAGIGALVVYTPPGCHGQEIEVSPVDDATTRTHAAVRARYVRGGVCYSVVIDKLPAGRYTVWRDETNALDVVEIVGGAVTEYDWIPEDRRVCEQARSTS
jgi:hypothetical protein